MCDEQLTYEYLNVLPKGFVSSALIVVVGVPTM